MMTQVMCYVIVTRYSVNGRMNLFQITKYIWVAAYFMTFFSKLQADFQ